MNITQAGESETLNNLGNKEEAMARFGTEMWDTLRRLQNAGIFNEPIADYVPPVDTGTDYGQFIFPEHFPSIFDSNKRLMPSFII